MSFVVDPDSFMTEVIEHISDMYPYIVVNTFDQDDEPLNSDVGPVVFSFNGERRLFFQIPIEYFSNHTDIYTIRGELKSELGSDFDIPNFFEIDKSSWTSEGGELFIHPDESIEVVGSFVYFYI